MKTDNSEYLPQNSDRQKAFSLAPAVDPISFTVISTREKACQDANLSHGAVRLFVFLLDLAMSPYCNVTRGVVVVSVTQIRERVHCARRSVFSWVRQLVVGNYLWVDKQFMPNFWALNRYHVTALDSQDQPSQLPTRDGMWGNGVRRPAAPSGSGARGGGAIFATGNPADNSQPVQTELDRRTEGHRTGASIATERRNDCDGGSQKRTPGSRKKGNAGVATIATGKATDCTAPSQKGSHIKLLESGIESEKDTLSSLTGKEAPGTARRGPVRQLSSFSGSPASKAIIEGEKDWLKRLGMIVGPKEMANWGGRWRNRFRDNHGKAERVLAELARMHRQKEITRNAGACANDLWERFK